jgi:hypothetical protein
MNARTKQKEKFLILFILMLFSLVSTGVAQTFNCASLVKSAPDAWNALEGKGPFGPPGSHVAQHFQCVTGLINKTYFLGKPNAASILAKATAKQPNQTAGPHDTTFNVALPIYNAHYKNNAGKCEDAGFNAVLIIWRYHKSRCELRHLFPKKN